VAGTNAQEGAWLNISSILRLSAIWKRGRSTLNSSYALRPTKLSTSLPTQQRPHIPGRIGRVD